MRTVRLGQDTALCGPTLLLSPGNGYLSYRWQDGSTAPTYLVQATGLFTIEVSDADSCIARDSIHVMIDCSDLNFPSAFTPNSDGLNDNFGAAGNLGLVRAFSLQIFNRWGQLVFQSNNPFQKWQPGNNYPTSTFVWIANYTLRNKPGQLQKKAPLHCCAEQIIAYASISQS